jgi:hypothetical protein
MTNRRLPFASSRGGYFEPEAEEWHRLEAAYGQELPDPVRREIRSAVARYFERVGFEQSAPTFKEGDAAVDRVQDQAKALLDELSNGDLSGFVEYVTSDHFSHERFSDLRLHLRDLIAACDLAWPNIKKLKESGAGFKQYDAWNEMSVAVIAALEKHGLNCAVWWNAAAERASPAAMLIEALQELPSFPKAYRRLLPSKSRPALVQQLKRAAQQQQA